MKISMVSAWAGVSLGVASLLACEPQAENKAEEVVELEQQKLEQAQENQREQNELAREHTEERKDLAVDNAEETQQVRGEDMNQPLDVGRDVQEDKQDLATDQAEEKNDLAQDRADDKKDVNEDLAEAKADFKTERRKFTLSARSRLDEIQRRADTIGNKGVKESQGDNAERNTALSSVKSDMRKLRADINALDKAPASTWQNQQQAIDDRIDRLEKQLSDAESGF